MQNIEKPPVRFGEWISEGWKMFTEQWKAWVLNTFVYLLICVFPIMVVVFGFYGYLILQVSQHPSRSGEFPLAPEAFITFSLVVFAVSFFTVFVSAFLMSGMHRSAFKQLRGGTIELRDLFSGGSAYFPILIASILTGILTVVGAMLCILPAFIVSGCLFFTIPLIVERRLGAIEAMKASYELTKNNLWMFTLFAFVVGLIAQAGSYVCYVGLLATIPLLFTISAVAYRDTFGLEGARYFVPQAPPSPSGYAQPFPDAYQQPMPPNYGQAGYEQYPGSGYQQPFPSSGYQQPQTPAAALPPSEPLLEHSVAPPNIEPPPSPNVEPPTLPADSTMPLSSIVSSAPSAAELTCAGCQLNLPATASFCPRCGTQVRQS